MSLLTPTVSQSHAVTSITTCLQLHSHTSALAILRCSRLRFSPVAARHTAVSIGDHARFCMITEKNINSIFEDQKYLKIKNIFLFLHNTSIHLRKRSTIAPKSRYFAFPFCRPSPAALPLRVPRKCFRVCDTIVQ
jgi:hypothetical protein